MLGKGGSVPLKPSQGSLEAFSWPLMMTSFEQWIVVSITATFHGERT